MDPTSPSTLPLFLDFPALEAGLPRLPLGFWPTPIEAPEALRQALDLPQLYLKREDLSAPHYGSNKVRKLEFLLAEAQRAGAQRVFTVGFAGSNHAVATAFYARQVGLACTSLLMPQPSAPYVRENLLAQLGLGAQVESCAHLLALGIRYWAWRRQAHFIPAGGTCPRGVAAYVNAAFELRAQVNAGALPEPDLLYLPLGSMGTAAGLSLGLQAAGLRTRVMAVRVIEPRWASPRGMRTLLRRSLAFLRDLDPSFPDLASLGENLSIRNDLMGSGYGVPTPAGRDAEALAYAHAKLRLNPTYSAKAFAALIADARAGRLEGQRVLYWNTYNTHDLGWLTQGQDYRALPLALQAHFASELSPAPGFGPCGTGRSENPDRT